MHRMLDRLPKVKYQVVWADYRKGTWAHLPRDQLLDRELQLHRLLLLRLHLPLLQVLLQRERLTDL